MNLHADVRWHNFTNIILCSAHLWYLYYFHSGKMGHFDDLLLYNAKTIFHLIEQRESHKLLSFKSLPSWPWVMTLCDVLKCLLMFYMMNPKWPCHETQKCLVRTWLVKSLVKGNQNSLHLILVTLFVDRTAVSVCD